MRLIPLGLALALLGCSGASQPAQGGATPPPAGTETAPAAPTPEADGKPPAEAGPAQTATAEAPAAAPKESIRAACEKMCDAIAPKCSKDQQTLCRTNCGEYAATPAACEDSTRAALGCITDSPDFLMCSGVVPERCSKKFKAKQKCEAEGSASAVKEQEGYSVPDGWALLQATEPRFKAAMPKGVETKNEAGSKRWVAKSASGATFEIAIQPPPPEQKVDQKVFLKVATKLLGKCSGGMKLHSIVEKPDRSVIHYSTKCPDKTARRGLLYVHGGHLYVLSVFWEGATQPPEADAFVYMFNPG